MEDSFPGGRGLVRRLRSSAALPLAGVVALAALTSAGAGELPGRTVVPVDVIALFEPWRGVLPAPVNTLLGDPVQQLSATAAVAEAERTGHLALWNPHVLAGHPLAGDPIVASFNPLQAVLLVLLPLHRAIAMQVLIQLIVAGLAMAFWVYTATRSRRAAAFAGGVWVLAGYHQVWVAYPYFMAALMWLPLIPAAWERGARGGSVGWIAVGGLAAGLSILGGHIVVALFGLCAVAAYALLALAALGVPARRGVMCGLGIVGLAALISAPSLLASAVQMADTVRPGRDAATMRLTGLPIRQAITAVVPWLFGRPDRGNYIGDQNANELMVYVGLVPLLLALAAPWTRRDRVGWVAGALLALVAALALGLVGAGLQAALPVTRYFIMRRWLSVWPLVAAFAGGSAVAAAVQRPEAARRLGHATLVAALALGVAAVAVPRALAGTVLADRAGLLAHDVAGALALLALSTGVIVVWSRSPASRLRFAAVLLLAMADLGTFARGYSPAGHVAGAYPLLPPLGEVARAASAEGARVAPVHRDHIVLGPGVAPMVGLDTIDGYSSSLQRSYVRFVSALSEPANDGDLASNPNMVGVSRIDPVLAQLLNIAYVLTDAPIAPTSRLTVAPVPAGPCADWHQLSVGDELSAAIRPNLNGLHRVDVLVRERGEPVRARLEVTRASPGGANQVIATQPVTATGELAVTTYFQRVPDSAGRGFTATLTAETPLDACAGGDPRALRTAAYAVDEEWPLSFAGNDLYAYHVTDRPGAAWLVDDVQAVDGQEAALAVVSAPGFDPRTTLVIEGPLPQRKAGAADATAAAGLRSGDVLAVRRPYPGAIDVELGRGASGWLAVPEAYAPGWRAWVDAEEMPVVRADGGIQAVQLARRARQVQLRFDPVPVRAGLLLAGLGLAAAVVLVAAAPLQRRKARRNIGDRPL